MKSKDRHELKENELAEWFVNLPNWFEKNRNTVIYATISLIVLIFGFWYYGIPLISSYRGYRYTIEQKKYERFTETLAQLSALKPRIVQSNLQQIDATSNLRELAKSLSDMADTTKDARTAAFAYIEQGKVLRTDVHYRLNTPDENQLAEQINKAKEAYGKALAKLEAAPAEKGKPLDETLAAEAIFGIGLCEEELGNLEMARKKYMEITSNPAYKYTTAVVESQQRLDIMADFEKTVEFEPSPNPVPESAAGGTIPVEMMQTPPVGSEVNSGPAIKPAADDNSPNSTAD